MFDEWFRIWKERWLSPFARTLAPWITPFHLTGTGFLFGVLSAVAASRAQWMFALAFWILNRVLDGLDGTLARARQHQTDFGGYLDILLDFVVYAAVPLGVAFALDSRATWIVLAVLQATFFVNAASWMYLAAVLERRGEGASARGEMTTVTMPRGLVAGTETVVFFTLFLVWPQHFVALAAVMAAGVSIGITQRIVWAARHLGSH